MVTNRRATEAFLEELVLWLVVFLIAVIGAIVIGIGAYERRHRKRVEALGKRRKDRIQL